MYLAIALTVMNIFFVCSFYYVFFWTVPVLALFIVMTLSGHLVILDSAVLDKHRIGHMQEIKELPYFWFVFMNFWATGFICLFAQFLVTGSIITTLNVVFSLALYKHAKGEWNE